MATQQQMEDLLAAIAAANDVTSNLDAEREKLRGYRATRQQYAALVDEQKIVVDNAVAASETVLRDLAAKIDAVFPPAP